MPVSRIEHVAFNVSDPVAMADWYVAHLGLRVLRKADTAPHMHFLADAQGAGVIEIYSNPVEAIPDYASMHPLRLHLAFQTDDPDATKNDLIAAGATLVDEQQTADGSRLVMLRDPWGFSIQLCRRATPLI